MTDQPIVTATNPLLGAGSSASAGADGAAASATPSWESTLQTASIKTAMEAADVNGVVTFEGLENVLGAVSSSTPLTSAEFKDLQTIAANLNNGLSTSSYLAYIFNAYVNGNPWNAVWNGGGGPVTLGNLAVGSSQTQMGLLAEKWFAGLDTPESGVDMSGSAHFMVSYSPPTPFSEELIDPSGPSTNDVNQGRLGDCYFLASCAEVAYMNPTYIESMFSYDAIGGTYSGTYGVRFYYDGVAEYVTWGGMLADGGTIFNHATSGYIWASVAEQAWANFQAINPDTGNSSYNDGNS
jgi:hypothetical protein